MKERKIWRGEKSERKKEKDRKEAELGGKRDGLSKCSSTRAQSCEFPGKTAWAAYLSALINPLRGCGGKHIGFGGQRGRERQR